MNVPILRNMSVAPRTVISHSASASPVARSTVFELPETVRDVRAAGLLALMGTSARGRAAEQELRRRIEQHAKALPWPPIVLATDQAGTLVDQCTDLLTIVAVLSKTGSKVYLRDKDPNLSSITEGRRVILRLPEKRSTP